MNYELCETAIGRFGRSKNGLLWRIESREGILIVSYVKVGVGTLFQPVFGPAVKKEAPATNVSAKPVLINATESLIDKFR